MKKNYTNSNKTEEKGSPLPYSLKGVMESLSGYDMSDVTVYYNSARPAQINAHAYAQGTNIYIAPGQEKYLPHETWHVIQQKQGRVKPGREIKDGIHINDEASLEKEAHIMGYIAVQLHTRAKDTKKNKSKTVVHSFSHQKSEQVKNLMYMDKYRQVILQQESPRKPDIIQMQTYSDFLGRNILNEGAFTTAVKAALANIVWGNGAPEVNIVENAGTTGAEYDAATHTISVQLEDPVNWDAVYDDVMFESYNALAQPAYDALNAIGNTKLEGQKTTSEFGRDKSDIEYGVSKNHVDAVIALQLADNLLPDRAMRALTARRADDGNNLSENDRKEAFAQSHHDQSAVLPAKGALGTADLYTYEQIEGFGEIGFCSSRMTKLVRQNNFDSFGGHISTSWSSLYNEGFGRSTLGRWPADNEKQKRPKKFHDAIQRMIVKARAEKQLITNDYRASNRQNKLDNWDAVISKLEEFLLNDYQLQVANANT